MKCRSNSFLLLASVIIVLGNSPGWAEEQHDDKASKTTIGSYCGLNCLYAAMKFQGRDIDFREFLNPKYIGSSSGSSISELDAAAHDHDMYTAIWKNLSTRELASINYPVILHVKPSVDATEYSHFILCLGTENGQFRIFDTPNPIRLVTPHDLAQIWDGVGLAVSIKPISNWAIVRDYGIKSTMWIFALMLCVLVAGWFSKRSPTDAGQPAAPNSAHFVSMAQGIGICIIALGGSIIYHSVDDLGLLAHPDTVSSIQELHVMSFAKKLSASDVERLIKNGATVVDARLNDDYVAGHIRGAINVPVNQRNSNARLESFTTTVPKDSKVIIYCQSATCPFSDAVGLSLWRTGYKQLYVYRGGWENWSAHMPKSETAIGN